MKLCVTSFAVLLAVATGADAAVIDFESAATGSQVQLPYSEDGYDVTGLAGGPTTRFIFNPTPGTVNSRLFVTGDATVRITATGGGSFNATSVTLPFVGLGAGSASIVSSSAATRVITNADNGNIVTLPAGFTNITYMDLVFTGFVADTVYVDDIVVVPEPSVAGLGLLAVGMLVRRRVRKC